MIKAHFSHVLPRDIRNERGCEEALVEHPAELVEYFPQFVGVFLKPAALVLFAIYRRLPAASRIAGRRDRSSFNSRYGRLIRLGGDGTTGGLSGYVFISISTTSLDRFRKR
jgi:hypothetical protein